MTDAHSTPQTSQQEHETAGPERTEGRLVLCPYCGHTQTNTVRCEACRGLFEPLSRKATQISMGPWFIRDTANPFRPGCSYETLKKLIESGRVNARSIIRGPTTRQFWSVARNVPGVAHLVGCCHRCHANVRSTDPRCPNCGEAFGGWTRRNELGLSYPTPEAVERASRELEQQRQAIAQGGAPSANSSPPPDRPSAAGSDDLLEQVLRTGPSSSPPAATPPAGMPPAASPASPASGARGAAPPSTAPEFNPGPPPLAQQSSAQQPPAASEPAGAHRSSAIVWLIVLINALFAAAAVLAAWHYLL